MENILYLSFLSSIIFPYLRHSNHSNHWLWTLKLLRNKTGRKWLQHCTCSTCLHPATFMTRCSWFTWAGISVIIVHLLSVASGRLVTHMVAITHSIIRAELKGKRTSCQFLKFFVSSPVDWALIWFQELLIHPVIICMEGAGENTVLIQFDPFTNYFWPLGVYTPASHKWGVRSLSNLAQPPLTFLAL